MRVNPYCMKADRQHKAKMKSIRKVQKASGLILGGGSGIGEALSAELLNRSIAKSGEL